jgi:transcriptional regulator with XRE-family HTH domain
MNRFKELRKGLHLTQAELIKQYNQRFNRTYSIPALSLFENGHRLPELPALKDFAEFFNCSVDYLIGRSDVPDKNVQDEPGLRLHTVIKPPENPESLKPLYYHDPEVAQMANELKDNPGMRVLFDASRGLKKESIEEVVKFIEFQKAKERGDY